MAAAVQKAAAAPPTVGTTIAATRLPIPAAVPAVGAPAGRVLPVVDPRVPPAAARPMPPAQPRQPASEVAGVPVRVQAESPRERAMPPPAAFVPTPEGDFWHGLVQQLVAAEAVTALVRELALQSQLLARDVGHWMLRVERESLNQPASRERLRAALKAAGHDVELGVEVGAVADSPARRNAQAAAERQQAAEQVILNDPFVQDMMRDFGAKIVPGSIKPVEKN
jgi:DNA polymerase-3 subunit gamma/tau